MTITLHLKWTYRQQWHTKRHAIFHGTAISHTCLMAFGYAPQGSGGMYCNQTPFPPLEGWGLDTRLPLPLPPDQNDHAYFPAMMT